MFEAMKLGDLCTLRAGSAFKTHFQGNATGRYPFIKVSDMNLPSNEICIREANNWVEESVREEIKAKPLPPGATVFAKIGEALKQNRVRYLVMETIVDNNMMGAIPNRNVIDPKFFYYLLSDFDIAGTATGTALPYLTVSTLVESTFQIPPLHVQQCIAGILSAYDELIENSQRRIKILESMARALYREWFVHFRFPGHENHPRVASPLGEIPQGWEVRTLAELCTRMESGGTPKRRNSEYWENGEIDWYKTGELWDGFLFGSQEKITARGQRESTARLFEPGTILMAIYGSPTVGRMGILTRHASCNQAALGLVANNALISQTYLYFVLFSLRDHFNSLAQGAAQQNISKEKVASALAIMPTRDILESFDRNAEPVFAQIQTLQLQVENLRRTRDLLLPRLLSGQIDVEAPRP